jgi:hypothetical protein
MFEIIALFGLTWEPFSAPFGLLWAPLGSSPSFWLLSVHFLILLLSGYIVVALALFSKFG